MARDPVASASTAPGLRMTRIEEINIRLGEITATRAALEREETALKVELGTLTPVYTVNFFDPTSTAIKPITDVTLAAIEKMTVAVSPLSGITKIESYRNGLQVYTAPVDATAKGLLSSGAYGWKADQGMYAIRVNGLQVGPSFKVTSGTPTPVPDPTPVPPTPTPTPGGFLKGVTHSTDWSGAGAMDQDMSIKLGRPWYGAGKNWDQAPSVSDFKYLKGISDKYGVRWVVLITPPENGSTIPTPAQSVGVWKMAVANARAAGFKPGDIWWEICNEPDLKPQYFAGSLSQYMDNILKPVYGYLHSVGEIVVGAATVTEANWKTILSLGYLNYCDIANHHPYDSNAKGQIARIDRILPTCNGKPLMLTEWGFHPASGTTDAAWAGYYVTAFASHKTRLKAVCYFHYKTYNSGGGHAGLIDASTMKPHQPFYDSYKAL